MENIVEEKVKLMNKMARALAKDEGITEVQALARIKQQFMDRDETAETIKGMNIPRIIDYSNNSPKVAPEDAYAVYSEQTKVELKKLEFQQKQLDADQKLQQKQHEAEQKKAELDARKLELAEKKIESDEKLAREKMEREDRYRQDQLALERDRQREDANFNRQMLLMNISGKKPDEMLEFMKSQSENNKEFYKSQGEGQKSMYEILLKTKDSERDRELQWKTELAKIEADREIEMAKLRQEDPTAADSSEVLMGFLGEKFDNLGKQLTTNPTNDFLVQIETHNKFQESLVRAAMPILKAQGLSDEQMEKVKKQVGMEEKREESAIGKFWDLGKVLWKNYVEPAADKATKELNAASSGLENKVSPEIEKRIREETQLKADQLKADNIILQQQLEEEKKRIQSLQEERRKLEATASQLGIPYDNTITNEQLFYWIEHQEAVIEQQKSAMERRAVLEQREERARRATIPREVAIQEVQEVHEKEGVQAFEAPQPQEQQEEQNIEAADADIEVPKTTMRNRLETPQDIITIQEELAKPREISVETQEFISSSGLDGELIAEKPEEEQPELEEKAKTQKKMKIKNQGKTSKRVFSVSNGTQVIEVESINHKGAALGVAKQLGGTEEVPVRVKVTDGYGEEREYETFSTERLSAKGKKWMAPRVKAAK